MNILILLILLSNIGLHVLLHNALPVPVNLWIETTFTQHCYILNPVGSCAIINIPVNPDHLTYSIVFLPPCDSSDIAHCLLTQYWHYKRTGCCLDSTIKCQCLQNKKNVFSYNVHTCFMCRYCANCAVSLS